MSTAVTQGYWEPFKAFNLTVVDLSYLKELSLKESWFLSGAVIKQDTHTTLFSTTALPVSVIKWSHGPSSKVWEGFRGWEKARRPWPATGPSSIGKLLQLNLCIAVVRNAQSVRGIDFVQGPTSHYSASGHHFHNCLEGSCYLHGLLGTVTGWGLQGMVGWEASS